MRAEQQKEQVFLFLQGPLSAYYSQIAGNLIEQGYRVHKIHICGNDIADWHHNDAINYSGSLADWFSFLDDTAMRLGVTDIVLHGDQRPYHKSAVEWARANKARVHVTELGYLRPDWMTVEPCGTSVNSRFPVEPEEVRNLAKLGDTPDFRPVYRDETWEVIAQEFRWTCFNLLHRVRFPKFKTHRSQSPWKVYSGWLMNQLRKRLVPGPQRYAVPSAPFFVMALQLEGDLQLVENSPFESMRDGIDHVMHSFLAHAPAGSHLVFKLHPNEFRRRQRRYDVAEIAKQLGISGRVHLVENIPISDLCQNAEGFVTVNSSAGFEALATGTPVCTITRTIYSVPGLTFQNGLDAFWQEKTAPDASLVNDLKSALCNTIQVRGTLYNKAGRRNAARETAQRLVNPVLQIKV